MAIDLGDYSQNSNTLTNSGATESADVPFVTANLISVDLELSESDYLYVADSASLSITGDITIEAWIKLEQLPSTAGLAFTIVGKYSVLDNKRSYFFGIGIDDKLEFFASDDGTSAGTHLVGYECDTAIAGAGTYYHVAVTFDISAETCLFFIDGIEKTTTQVFGTTIGASIDDNNVNFTIGTRYDGLGAPEAFLDSLIDEVRLWDDVRGTAEIAANYNQRLAAPGGEANLQAYYPYDTGEAAAERGFMTTNTKFW